MVHCVVFGCSNKTKTKRDTRLSFFRFPQGQGRNVWTQAIRRENGFPNNYSFVCSDHFSSDQINSTYPSGLRLRENAVPNIFPSYPEYLKPNLKPTFFKIIQQNGGVMRSAYKLFRQDELKLGTLVGEDKYGNKYFENNMYFYGRNRWVEYNDNVFLDYDGSQVPAEWFGWLHYKTDLPPHKDPSRPKYPWMAEHTENLSGTERQYVPYSTTRPKIEPWIPPKRS